ncbi:MAG: M20/M25/M40 family metallo-hydrolase [Bacteroidales bacterium]|nr:M20/M25/M40 family metallo-hydrolase [Bacteroidales bacterium]
MRKIHLVLILVVALLSAAPLKAQIQASDFYGVYSTEYAKKVVDFLADSKLKGREAGTKEASKAMKFIAKEFKKAGYKPVLQSFGRDELVAAIGEPRKGKAPYPLQQCNVVAKLEGKQKDKYIVVGAHYDHLGYKEGVGIHPGADDNASGIVALLSLAKMFKAAAIVPEYTILFCAWDGEEKGLLGSKYFVKSWPSEELVADCDGTLKESVIHYMNFDMVGRTITPENPGVTFAWNNNYPYLLDICKEAQKSISAPFQVLLDERRGDGKGGSDYAPFSALDIPFIAWMEDFMHVDYHKPTDVPSKLHWEKLRKTTLLAYAILYELATA